MDIELQHNSPTQHKNKSQISLPQAVFQLSTYNRSDQFALFI